MKLRTKLTWLGLVFLLLSSINMNASACNGITLTMQVDPRLTNQYYAQLHVDSQAVPNMFTPLAGNNSPLTNFCISSQVLKPYNINDKKNHTISFFVVAQDPNTGKNTDIGYVKFNYLNKSMTFKETDPYLWGYVNGWGTDTIIKVLM